MKNEKLIRAMSEIDEDLILEAHETVRPRWRRRIVGWTALAACLTLLLLYSPILWINLVGAGAADMEAERPGNIFDADKSECLTTGENGGSDDRDFAFENMPDAEQDAETDSAWEEPCETEETETEPSSETAHADGQGGAR